MKVILKGINYEGLDLEDFCDSKYIALLKQVPYPIQVETEGNWPHVVRLKDYIKDPDRPSNLEEWGLIWFDYEEVKD